MSIKVEGCFDSAFGQAKIKIRYRNKKTAKQDLHNTTPNMDDTTSGERKTRMFAEVRRRRKTPGPRPKLVVEDSVSKPKKHEVITEKKRNADSTTTPKYTQIQLELINKVLNCTNLYDVLNVKHSDCESAIKKSYKKLALQLHPDKNNAPGAVDAFKKISNAASILCDRHKREEYDFRGHSNIMTFNAPSQQRSEANTQETSNTRPTHQEEHHYRNDGINTNYFRDYERTFNRQFEDCDAEQFFQLFFNPFSMDEREQRRRDEVLEKWKRRKSQRQSKCWNFLCKYSILLALMTAIILAYLVFTFIIPPSDYSFAPSQTYPLRRETKHLSIAYYVKESFLNDYKGSIKKFENAVEMEFIQRLKEQCANERLYRNQVTKIYYKDGGSLKSYKPISMRLPACEELSRLVIIEFIEKLRIIFPLNLQDFVFLALTVWAMF